MINGARVQGFLFQNGLQPVAELDAANNLITRFVYAGVTAAPDYMIKAGVTYRIIADERGSPRLVVDATTGVIVQRMDYDTFGNVTLDTNPGFQPFGFAGGLLDRDTGLTRFGARDYDPEIGRWTSKDAALLAGGANVYEYAYSDPINFVDNSGLEPEFDAEDVVSDYGSFGSSYAGAAASAGVTTEPDALAFSLRLSVAGPVGSRAGRRPCVT